MPIYEYSCDACGREFDLLMHHAASNAGVRCPDCGSAKASRKFSSFATHRSEMSRVADFDPTRARDPGFYRDTRNIGLAAKRRAQRLGTPAGGRMDEIVEKARTGRFLDA